MASVPFFISEIVCHEDEDQHELHLRVRHNGRLFFLTYHMKYFVRSPRIRATYLRYLQEIRDCEVNYDDRDAFRWFLKPFEAMIFKLAPPVSRITPPTLARYAFPDFFSCRLDAVDEKFEPKQLDKWDAAAGPPGLKILEHLMQDLNSWTSLYDPSEVILCHDRLEDALVKPPNWVQLSNGGENNMSYFLQSFVEFGGLYQLERELVTFKQIAKSNMKAKAHITRLHGVVTSKDG